MATDYAALSERLGVLKNIFRPSAPTDDARFFRGRLREIESVLNGVAEIGQHVTVYGERGVGKTSLGLIAQSYFAVSNTAHRLTVRVQCSDGDTFTSVWHEFRRSLRAQIEKDRHKAAFFSDDTLTMVGTLLSPPALTSHDVARALADLAASAQLLIILDEFDRLGGWDKTVAFADLVKTLSDDRTDATVLIIGVADNIDGLIQGHQSISRNLRQVAMPRMTEDELVSIVTDGYEAFSVDSDTKLECDPVAARSIAKIAQGFPYYAHLLAGAAGATAIRGDQASVSVATVFSSMILAVEDVDHAIRAAYTNAITARADANIADSLLACALAQTDDLGYFSSSDVAIALSTLTGESRSAGNVNGHLRRFSEAPDWLLEKMQRSTRRIRYRFRDPLMKPFVLMKGYELGKLGKIGGDSD